MKHKENCNCSICNNGIREERQYAALEFKDECYITLDAQEYSHFDDWMQMKKKGEKQPEYEKVDPYEDTPLQLVYGVLVPAEKKAMRIILRK